MIGGVGDGTFVMCIAIGVGVLLCILGWCFVPDAILGIFIAAVVLPLMVYGLLLTAPKKAALNTTPIDEEAMLRRSLAYRERVFLPSDTTAVDTFLPVRLVVFLLMFFCGLGGFGMQIVFTLILEPPYKVPRMRCLREQLEEAHPSWYK